MKINILYLSLLLIMISSVSVAAQKNANVETILCETWDKESDTWLPLTNIHFFYRADKQKSTVVTQEWDDLLENWKDTHKQVYSYDAQNRIVKILIQEWGRDKKEWKHVLKKTKNYRDKETATYVQYTTDTVFFWKEDMLFWEPVFLNTYVYKNDKLTSKQVYLPNFQQEENGWLELSSEEYDYSATDKLTKANYFVYDLVTLENREVAQDSYEYMQENMLNRKIHKTYQINTNTWQKTKQEVYTYNKWGKTTHKTWQVWDVIQNTWVNKNREVIQYDDKQNVTQTLSQVWNECNQQWVNEKRYSYRLAIQVLSFPIQQNNSQREVSYKNYLSTINRQSISEYGKLFLYDLENEANKKGKFILAIEDMEAGSFPRRQ